MILLSVFLAFFTACSAAVATYHDLPPEIVVHHAAQLVDGRYTKVTWEQLHHFRVYAEYVCEAYSSPVVSGRKVSCQGDNCPPENATYSEFLISDLPGFVAIDHSRKEIIISIRGTQTIDEWLDNIFRSSLEDWETGICEDCKVHKGWQLAEQRFNGEVTELIRGLVGQFGAYKITAVGHSRGGALATILAARLRMDLETNVTTYTYGSPRVGNEAFARFASGQGDRNYRITHFNDPVPGVPFFFMDYRHIEPEYWLEEGPATRIDYKPDDVQKCHDWTEYSCIEPFDQGNWWDKRARISHSYYLTDFNRCGPRTSPDRASDELLWNPAVISEDTMMHLREGFTEDIKYAASLHNHSLLAEYRWTGWAAK